MSKLLITDTICQKAFPEDVGKLMAEKTTSMAERLHLARIRIGLHMVGLAKATGFARSTLIALEAGKSFPHPKTIRRLAEVLGVDETWLVFGDPAPGLGTLNREFRPPRPDTIEAKRAKEDVDMVLACLTHNRREIEIRLEERLKVGGMGVANVLALLKDALVSAGQWEEPVHED